MIICSVSFCMELPLRAPFGKGKLPGTNIGRSFIGNTRLMKGRLLTVADCGDGLRLIARNISPTTLKNMTHSPRLLCVDRDEEKVGVDCASFTTHNPSTAEWKGSFSLFNADLYLYGRVALVKHHPLLVFTPRFPPEQRSTVRHLLSPSEHTNFWSW